jgi:hypothetical protein
MVLAYFFYRNFFVWQGVKIMLILGRQIGGAVMELNNHGNR